MKKTGFGLIIVGVILCICSMSFLPAGNSVDVFHDVMRLVFLTGSYLVMVIIGSLLVLLDKLNEKK